MSIDYSNLCAVIIRQCFGDVAQVVAGSLFDATARTVNSIAKTTNLSKKEVCSALALLIKYQLVSFQACDSNPQIADYELKREEVLNILRYSRYVYVIQTKYGTVGGAIAEEILYEGSQTATNAIIKSVANADNKEEKLETYRDTFIQMVCDNYLIRLPQLVKVEAESMDVPKLHIEPYDLFKPPDIDLRYIAQSQNDTEQQEPAKDENIYWQLNFKRFHQDFRDAVMISAVERKMGSSAAECFKYILQQIYARTDPWQKDSSIPFTFGEIKQVIEKKSNNLDLIKYLDHYIALIADDSLGFLRKIGDMGGGEFVVELKTAFEQLALACIENVITERFGSKASRIFRVIRMKTYIEQEDIQKEAMIPAKEAKLLSYKLFQEQFIQIRTIRKAGGGGSGPAKAFYLFHLKINQIVRMLLDMCFKALYNNITRSDCEKSENNRLIEKSQKLESIVDAMRTRGESEEYIAEILDTLTPPEREILEKAKARIQTLAKSVLTLDDNIFLFQMYLYHATHIIPPLSANKK